MKTFQITVYVAAAAIWAIYIFGGGINRSVINDAEKQLSIAARSGNRADACAHAMMVSAAYLQANDESGYQGAKSRERSYC